MGGGDSYYQNVQTIGPIGMKFVMSAWGRCEMVNIH